MRASSTFLVPQQMLIFQCGTLPGSDQKFNMGLTQPVIWGLGCKQTIPDSPPLPNLQGVLSYSEPYATLTPSPTLKN